MAVIWASPAFPFVQYDGTNSAEIMDALEEYVPGDIVTVFTWSIASETGGVLVIRLNTTEGINQDYATVNETDWFRVSGGEVITDGQFQERYVKVV